jgi:sulfate transport system substrate-binding protein
MTDTIAANSPTRRAILSSAVAASALVGQAARAQAQAATLLNVSYDATRELYQDIDKAFVAYWKQRTGQDLKINQSHNGSGASARAVIDGLAADVVTLALAYDIDEIVLKAHLLPANWQSRLPDNSTPYTSTIVLLVRKGNPKRIKDWGDLIKPGVGVITPNPKTGGGSRWNYLAAWDWARRQPGGSDATARAFVQALYKQVAVLDTGSRGSATSFTQRHIGDVFLAWESDAYLILDELPDQYEIVIPSSSILTEPPVAVVDKNVDRNKTRVIAEGYLNFLYSPQAQDIIGRRHYRPRNPVAAAKYSAKFPPLKLCTIADFGGWAKAQAVHFDNGGVFDQIYKPG